MDNFLRPIRDYAHSPSITQPMRMKSTIHANNLKLKSITLQLLQGVQFIGLPPEDPNAHILNFLEVCNKVKYNGVSDEVQSSKRRSHQNFKIRVVLLYHSFSGTHYQVKLFVTWG